MFRRPARILILALSAGNCLSQSIITTKAGTDFVFPTTSIPALGAPIGNVGGVALNNTGALLVTDTYRHLVLRISPQGQLVVVAGNSIQGLSGDGGIATSASLNTPNRIAVDPAGNLFITDTNNHRIRKITPSGIITTVAGNGSPGFSGDGGAATAAALDLPRGVAVDSAGNIFIADYGNNRVRKVDSGGTISTVAGNGNPAYSGDGGSPVQASLNLPQSVAVDKLGNLYIADTGNNRIRKVTPAGFVAGTITTFAGDGNQGYGGDGGKAVDAFLSLPLDVALDSSGNLFIADYLNNRIRKVTADGLIQTVAGNGRRGYDGDGGPATVATLGGPYGITVDSSGTIFLSDFLYTKVRMIAPTGTISTIADNVPHAALSTKTEPAAGQVLLGPDGAAWDQSGNLFISDCSNNRVRKLTPDGNIVTVAGSGLQGFSGDGGIATAASLNCPIGLIFDSAGNLIIADTYNNRIRELRLDGTITTIAGNGDSVYSGDGVSATNAALNLPADVALDANGNLYICEFLGQRVRKVTTAGIISTVAGNGVAGYSGDGGLATNATLNYPSGVGVDAAANLYIADSSNNAIRKVSASGIIATLAGTGAAGFSGDAGPASKASLSYPTSVASDASGNLLVADNGNNRIRRIAPDGTITTFAGNGTRGFSGDGGPPAAASLALPGTAKVSSTGVVAIADSYNNRIRVVLIQAPSAQVTPTALSFSTLSGGTPTAQQSIDVLSSVSGLTFNTSVTGDLGGAWLTVSQASGNTPAMIQLGVDPSQLSPGTYNATVTVTFANATPATQTVQVACVLTGAQSAHLAAPTSALTFSLFQGASTATLQLPVTNTGGGSLSFTAAPVTASGGAWLTVDPTSSAATAAKPVTLTVSANPAGLTPGTYTGGIVIHSSTTGETVTVPVNLTIRAAQPKVVLSQTGLTFTAVAQGGVPLPQSFGILNAGTGSMDWTAQASTLSGSNWLSISQPSGTVVQPLQDVSFVNVIVDASSLQPGDYFGNIQVSASGADNSPQSLVVVLNVLPPGSNPGPEVRPTGLVFTGVAGSESAGSQNVMVSNVSGAPQLTYGSNVAYLPEGNWVTYVPTSANLSPGTPGQIVVQPDFTGLGPNVYRAALTLIFSDGTIRSVSILSVLSAGAASSSSALAAGGRDNVVPRAGEPFAGSCSATSIQILPTNSQQVFTASINQPYPLEVQLVDSCSVPVTPQNSSASVLATFDNGDKAVTLMHTQNGKWTGTWQPQGGGPGSSVRVSITALVVKGNNTLINQANLTGLLVAGADVPLVSSGSVLNGASFAAQETTAPGTLVSLFGSSLASGLTTGSVPLPTVLGGTEILLGGQPLPLQFASDLQINAEIPYQVPVNTQLQLQVRRGTALSVPQSITVASAQPAIFTQDQSGRGQGAIVNTNNMIVDPGAPATAGDTVVIYCTGLGGVNPPIDAGAAAPSSPLSMTANPVTVAIGGLPAQVSFSGLTPGSAGLYQVNAVVPAGVAPGDQVPVVLFVAGQPSPSVTMAVR
jgi:uncharacterized protein (TIGR03437 family)